jgi:amino acid adenylation domain-containing protein
MNTHRAIRNRLLWMQDAYGLGADDRVLQKTPFSFDVSVWEFFWPLMTGARLVVAKPGGHQDPSYLISTIEREGITTLHFVPSMLRVFLGAPGLERCTSIRRVICSGETLPLDLAQLFFERFHATELHNLYGPTEAAVDVTAWACGPEDASVPIGRPIANTRIHLLDRELRPVPVGIPGELYIGGVQPARGYHGRPELTAERFLPDGNGERLYKSGDLARYRPDGAIELLGRLDHQVKIRGFRIEPGEIEAALAAHPRVKDAVVVARGRLVAYVVAPADHGDDLAATLREHLGKSLPEPMVPSVFVVLEALPLSPNGKVDRKALPEPEAPVSRQERAEPRTELERYLAGLWSESLGVGDIGVHDSFFELGGNSISGAVLINRLQRRLDETVPVAALFDAPTVAGMAAHLRSAHAGAVTRIWGEEGVEAPAAAERWRTIERLGVPPGTPLPLSFAQERMWFLDRLERGANVYNLMRPLRLAGELDEARLRGALTGLVARHETLRTVFADGGEGAVQIVRPPFPFPLPCVDLRALPEGVREAEVRRLAADEAALPFDLARDPMLRGTVLRLAGESAGVGERVLFLTMHHIASDGWSMRVLIRDLVALYRAAVTGESPDLPELPIQYADYAAWQRRSLAGEGLESELAYWRGRLADAPAALALPADRRRAGATGFQGAAADLVLPGPLVRAVAALSRRHGASPYMVLLTAWATLLMRASGQEDFLIGAPTANRHRAEIEELIGFFLNTLPLRTPLGGDPAFGLAVARVRETVLGAFSHGALPLASILQPLPAEQRTSPFQAMFLLQNFPRWKDPVPGLAVSVVDADRRYEDLGTAILEAGLTLVEPQEETSGEIGLTAVLTYNARLFDPETIDLLLRRYRRLLEGIVADPGRSLWSYELMEPEELRQVLAWGAASAAQAAPFEPVHRRFAARAAADPKAPAVLGTAGPTGTTGTSGTVLSYGELDRAANRLARRLRRLGIGPERTVGVAVGRSPAMIVALLGVLKAGAAYVPLDLAHPAERLAGMLEDAGAAALVTTEAALAAAPRLARGERPVLRLDADAALLAAESGADPGVAVDPDSVAYVLYTSGSTGRPKGVMVRHGGLANYVAGFVAEHGVGPADRVLQFASIAFDTSAEEIFPALASGAALVLRSDEMLASTAELLGRCAADGVTVLDLPTAFWHELVLRLEEERIALPRSIRRVILGGERALPERVALWRAQAHEGVLLLNTYGPTEATIVATRAELTADPAGEVPIGRPVAGARAWVLDPRGLPVAPGLPGELFLGGAGLARGYLGRPDLTAERFLPDPWSEPGARMYATGDRVRLLRSGELEFLGRVDQQVKVRGVRVELREVEAALASHPAVREAVVVAREETPGELRLVGYAVAKPEEAPSAADLRAWLRERLPDPMVPPAFVVLESLPLTPNGKVDRRALPAPSAHGADGAETEKAFVAPATEAEETVAAIWRQVLGVPRVGATDDFFALGGHSLLLPQVMHRLRAAFRVEIPLRALFDEPTVEGLALTIEEILLDEIERQLAEEDAVAE